MQPEWYCLHFQKSRQSSGYAYRPHEAESRKPDRQESYWAGRAGVENKLSLNVIIMVSNETGMSKLMMKR